jgi:GTP cyclohydrolase I
MYLPAGSGVGRTLMLPVMQLGQVSYVPGASVPGLTQAAMLQRMLAQQQLQQHMQRQQLMAMAGQGAGMFANTAGAVGGVYQQQSNQQ